MNEEAQQDVRVNDYRRDDGMVGEMRRMKQDLIETKERCKRLEADNRSLTMKADNLMMDNDRLESQVTIQTAKIETLKWVIGILVKK